jgi:hypothetical protein
MKTKFLWIGLLALCAAPHLIGKEQYPKQDLAAIFQDNPHMYQYGTVLEVAIGHPDPRKTWTVILFAPHMAPLLYWEVLTFCGDRTDSFDGAVGQEVIITMNKHAPQFVSFPEGGKMTCSSLDGIRILKKEKLQLQ